MTYIVRFEPWGNEIECAEGTTILEAARLAEIPVSAACSGRGACNRCQVRILTPPAPPPTATESAALSESALARGMRLACLHPVTTDMTLEVLPIVSHGKAEALPGDRAFVRAPAVQRRAVAVQPPNLERPVDDATSLLAALGLPAGVIDLRVGQALSGTLRAAGWRVSASVRGEEVIAIHPIGVGQPLGLAVDLGTTNIAGYLYNLEDGTLLGVFVAVNPLASYGADILSRLVYAGQSAQHSARLQRILVKALNLLIENATATLASTPEHLDEVVVVGNSGMHHLLLDLPTRQLTLAPYVPATRRAMAIKAREIGLAAGAGAYVIMPPLVGGFVGSDLLAVALVTRLDRQPGVRLAMDIGTNTELLLSVDGRLTSCSTASGPALEGAALRHGSVAGPGAVDRVWLDAGDVPTLQFRTIGGRPAIGICGSGIVDALACMRRIGVISAAGRIQAGRENVEVRPDGDRLFRLGRAEQTALGEALTISQHDVRAIQLAKGAIRGGIATLLADRGLTEGDLDEVLVAGAFGNHITVESAQAVGLYPQIPAERIRTIGNAAGGGAALMLLSTDERREAEAMSARIHYMELARHGRFVRLFAEAQRFPEP
jgi:uncharacterized 2Fe-2S/4Fe-4S cluster protein (DUF4445 family)